jgi:hypothetical protein
MPYPIKAPRIERAFTSEIETPFREGKGLCIRWGTKAFIFGKWGSPNPELAKDSLGRLEAEPLKITTEEIREWPKVGYEVL